MFILEIKHSRPIRGRIWEGSRVQWNPLRSTEGAWNPLSQSFPGNLWNPLDVVVANLGGLQGPVEPSALHRGCLEPYGPECSWKLLDLEPSGRSSVEFGRVTGSRGTLCTRQRVPGTLWARVFLETSGLGTLWNPLDVAVSNLGGFQGPVEHSEL